MFKDQVTEHASSFSGSECSKRRFGLLPQQVKFPSPLVGEGTTYTIMPPLKGLPSLAREGMRVGLFPAMGNHTATEKNSSLRGRIEVGANPVRGKAAFTLAEVLITLAIIGVVAALTLPTLIAKVNEKVDGNQKKVTEAKLIQGLNMLDLHGGINNTYSSTAEFVEELSKYMKITKI
ncbi:type II secretion system protein, partial [bacterium]|nr:type II secretion system protein [bacterium]